MSEPDVVKILRELSRLQTTVEDVVLQLKVINTRVNDLEISRATERGAALQRAATIEDVRVVRATDLAKKQWIKPGLVAVAVVVLDAALRLLNHH